MNLDWPLRMVDDAYAHGWYEQHDEVIVGGSRLRSDQLSEAVADVIAALGIATRFCSEYPRGLPAVLQALGFSEGESRAMQWEGDGFERAPFARADVIDTSAGLKLLELNVGPCIGGLIDASLPRLTGLHQHENALDAWARHVSLCIGGRGVGRMVEDGCYLTPFRRYLPSFQDALARVGLNDFTMCSVADLRFVDGRLMAEAEVDWLIPVFFPYHTEGAPERYDALSRAISARAVKMPIRLLSHALGSKLLLAELWQSVELGNCGAGERRVIERLVARTWKLNASSAEMAIQGQSDLVIKPANGFGGAGVLIGREVSQRQWCSAIQEAFRAQRPYVVQEFCPSTSREVIAVRPGGSVNQYRANLIWGIYVANGLQCGAPLVRGKRVDQSQVINYSAGAAIGPYCKFEDAKAHLPESNSTKLPATFALLDDNFGAEAVSRFYLDLHDTFQCSDATMLDDTWAKVASCLSQGLYVVLLADYEWGTKLQLENVAESRTGSVLFLVFRTLHMMHNQDVEALLSSLHGSGSAPALLSRLTPSISKSEYFEAIREVKELIKAGETYQINFTYRLTGYAHGNVIGLYRKLRQRQKVAYGALICLRHNSVPFEWILSRSPELFVEHIDGAMRAKPMKGTAPRHEDALKDAENSLWLASDPKNRSENLMIVDLLRNDLGRISSIGSVKVPRLFDVEQYSTVFQMTSTVESKLLDNVSFPDVLRALFPCGSITGAPKIQTMKRISELESTERGLYTGAIGWIDPSGPRTKAGACPNFCLSVAIRTLTLGKESDGTRPATYGVGGGIVFDSDAEDEFDETIAKTKFLHGLHPGLALIETMRVSARSAPLLALHLRRLTSSCKDLGFSIAEADVRRELERHIAALDIATDHRVRIEVALDGRIDVTSSQVASATRRVFVVLANAKLTSDELSFSSHKTTYRPTYSAELKRATELGAFDAVFSDRNDLVTEGARTNIFVRKGDKWRTPRLRPGVLPGVMRSILLLDPKMNATEDAVRLEELLHADQLIVCNAVHGALHADLLLV